MCVVGEFKQGKSSLVNALLGSTVCPVDDDFATSAITLVRYAEQVSVVVRHKDGEEVVSTPVAPAPMMGGYTPMPYGYPGANGYAGPNGCAACGCNGGGGRERDGVAGRVGVRGRRIIER